MKKSVLYIQSGGPTSVINSSLYGAYSFWRDHKDEFGTFLGSLHGIEGILNDNLIDLSYEDEKEMELLTQTPGAVLGSSRKKMPSDVADPLYEQVISNVVKHNIGYILVNGGNDSMDTCNKLSCLFKEKEMDVKVIGIPKTVDNDLDITDHAAGFGSAAKYVVNAVHSIVVDATCYSINKITVIEIMGRAAGWLTASVDLLPEHGRPDLIYVPEAEFDLDKALERMKAIFDEKKVCIVAISEGIDLGRDTGATKIDGFGHVQFAGTGARLTEIIEARFGLKTRCVELNLPTRAFPALTSKVDMDEAIECGTFGLESALKGETGQMVVIKRVSSTPYQKELTLYPVSSIANKEKIMSKEMLVDDTRMSQAYRDYCSPLIQGEVTPIYEHGIVKTARLVKHKA